MNDAPLQHRCTRDEKVACQLLTVDLISYYNFLSPWFGLVLELCRLVTMIMVLVVWCISKLRAKPVEFPIEMGPIAGVLRRQV